MTYLLTATLALFSIGVAHAQITLSLGPKLGVNASTSHYYVADIKTYHPSYTYGAKAGVLAVASHQRFSLQLAALYSQKGFQLDDESRDRQQYRLIHQVCQLDYLTLPVSVGFSLREDKQGVQVFAGGYLGWLVKGRVRFDDQYVLFDTTPPSTYSFKGEAKLERGDKIQLTSASAQEYTKGMDAGVQAGVGYRYKQVLLQATYSVGLVDLAPKYIDATGGVAVTSASYKNRVVQVSLAYLFEVRK